MLHCFASWLIIVSRTVKNLRSPVTAYRHGWGNRASVRLENGKNSLRCAHTSLLIKPKQELPSNSIEHRDVLPDLSKIENSSQKILSLGYDLASAHRAATARLIDESQNSLTPLQQAIVVALALLLVVGGWIVIISAAK
jgi:hypothetical protein